MTRALFFTVSSFCLLGLAAAADKLPEKYRVHVGTSTRGTKSAGIYRMELDLATGKLSKPEVAAKADNPSFLAIDPAGKFLYAVEETGAHGKKPSGAVAAFAIEETGDLKFLNNRLTGGANPCHLVLDKGGKYVLVANDTGGSACVLSISEDGKLGEQTSFVQHRGRSVDKTRQKEPHAHSINLDADNRFAFVADLGLDKIMIYRFEKGKLTENNPPSASTRPGAGPHHLAFHPKGKFAYVTDELDSTVSVFAYDAKKGALRLLQVISTLPRARFRPTELGEDPARKGRFNRNSAAEVVIHPSGKFLYCSNRGHNSIAMFDLDSVSGQLRSLGHQDMGIKTPRNFAIDPTGKFCLVANQDSDSVIVFKVAKDGKLEQTKQKVLIPSPVCLRFLAVTR